MNKLEVVDIEEVKDFIMTGLLYKCRRGDIL